jgi:hypothetical protein
MYPPAINRGLLAHFPFIDDFPSNKPPGWVFSRQPHLITGGKIKYRI